MCVCRVVDHRRGTCQAKPHSTALTCTAMCFHSLSLTRLLLLCAAAVDSQTCFALRASLGRAA